MPTDNQRNATPERRQRQRFSKALRDRPETFLALLIFVVVIGGWELVVRLSNVPAIIIPAPSAVFVSLVESLQSPRFLRNLWITLFETIA